MLIMKKIRIKIIKTGDYSMVIKIDDDKARSFFNSFHTVDIVLHITKCEFMAISDIVKSDNIVILYFNNKVPAKCIVNRKLRITFNYHICRCVISIDYENSRSK